jgi:hypothetical protein
MIKKHAPNFMAFFYRSLAEQVGRVTGLMLIRPLIYDYPEFHNFTSGFITKVLEANMR